MTDGKDYRNQLRDYLVEQARPRHKFGHQPRLYQLTKSLGAGLVYDDDVVYAAAWLHDLGVFLGHRPEEPERLRQWDHVAYTVEKAPGVLRSMDFPAAKIDAVLEVIRTHQPHDVPASTEAIVVRDADILEQLGAIGVMRTAAKVGSDTRFATFTEARQALARALAMLPGAIRLERTRELAAPRLVVLRAFLAALEEEAGGELG